MQVVAFRSAEWDTPWWSSANRGAGRYNRLNSAPTQYWCVHPLGPFAERLRGLGPLVIDDIDTIRWRTWAGLIDVDDLVTVGFDDAAAHGIGADELVGDDWGPCQDLADRLRSAGVPGVIVPSAALPGTDNIILFGSRYTSPFLSPVMDPAVDVATAHVAEMATPPEELVPGIRWHGEPHAAVEAWKVGDAYVYLDAVPPRR